MKKGSFTIWLPRIRCPSSATFSTTRSIHVFWDLISRPETCKEEEEERTKEEEEEGWQRKKKIEHRRYAQERDFLYHSEGWSFCNLVALVF